MSIRSSAKNLLLLLILLLSSYANAQVMGNYEVQQRGLSPNQRNTFTNTNFNAQYRAVPKAASFAGENVVEISINALSNQRADAYVALFNVVQIGKTAEETNSGLQRRLELLQEALVDKGISKEDIYIDMVNFLPRYEFDVTKKMFSKKTYTEIPKGFELQKNIHIRYRRPEMLDQIINVAAQHEIYDIVKVDHFVEEPQKVYADLRTAAFAYLEDVKEKYRTNGMQLDSAYMLTAENAWVAYPGNRYESYQAFQGQKLDQEVRSTANVNPIDKPISRFYNAVPANDYDIVINPDILEPAVQFSYNLVIRFTLPERKPKVTQTVTKQFIMVTPEGEVKTLKVE